ncbi:MAG: hypothetical protein DSY82_03600 [Flavobacteriia bacterium]|nr:MAG: hypothetical protein DSY82_03600 [Flavobacteriia bacterium]
MKKQIQVKQKKRIANVFVLIFFIFQFNSVFGQIKKEKEDPMLIYEILNTCFSNKGSVYLYEKTINYLDRDLSFLYHMINWKEAQYSLCNAGRPHIDLKGILSSDIIKELIATIKKKPPVRLNKQFLDDKFILYKKSDNLVPNKLKFRISNVYKFIKKDKTYIFVYKEEFYTSDDGYGAIYLFEQDHRQFKLIFEFGLWIA